jgi:Asp-tRNA(Asn)/Glu-tRNA(Gln) amidotransferase C subunit
MAHLTSEQLDRLQQLSNITLTSWEQEDFLQKLDPVIAKLEELWSVDVSDGKLENAFEPSYVTLRVLDTTFEWEKQKDIATNIIKNVEHEVINNSVVIKSVLS